MTIKATFPDGTIILCGDSYKRWWEQLSEYCRYEKKSHPSVEKCYAKWIGYGGLKWCTLDYLPTALQEELTGRSVSEFKEWKPLNQIETRTLNKYVPILGHNVSGMARRSRA